jgi:hypothetical protein
MPKIHGMSRYLGPLLGLFLFLFGAVGYVYYGPPHHTHFVTRTTFYRKALGPLLDRFLAERGVDGFAVGYLNAGEGELSYRGTSSLVFKPAREGQRFFGGTVVSTGPSSKGAITLFDDSVLELAENTTVILEIPQVSELGAVVDLQVVTGSVSAEKKSAQNIQIKVSNKKTQAQIVRNQKVVLAEESEKAIPLTQFADAPPATTPQSTSIAATPDPGLESLQSKVLTTPTGGDLKLLEVPSDLAFEAPTLQIEGEQIPDSADRQLAALPDPEPDWPDEIAPRAIPKRKKKIVVQVKEFEPPPEINDLSNALFAIKKGDSVSAQRHLASSLTRKTYFGKTFNPASQFALNGILENYLKNKECDLAMAILENAKQAFAKSKDAQNWASGWQIKSIKYCGKL